MFNGSLLMFLAAAFLVAGLVALVAAYRAGSPRKTATALATSEAINHSLMDALADGIFVAQDSRFVFTNAALPRLLGYEPEDFVDMPFEAVVAPDSLPQWNERYALRVGTGAEPARAYEVRFLKKGAAGVLELELVATRASFKGKPAVVGLVREIAERKRIEAELSAYRSGLEDLVATRTRALVQANEFARLIADNIPGRVAYWDQDMRCRFVNLGYCAWFGKSQADLLDRTVDEIFGPDRDRAKDARAHAALAGEPQIFERDEVSSSGQRATSLVHYTPDVADGRVRGFFVLALDVTAQHDAQVQLNELNKDLTRARDQAQAADRAKSAFLANISHEIRTPMNAIVGLAHLMRRDDPDGPHGDRLKRIGDASHHLLALINGILDLSKIEAGQLVLEETDFALDSLLTRSFAMVAETARDKGLELVIDTDHVPRLLRGDPTRLSQALVNLLGNAVKFTERGSVSLVASIVDKSGDSLGLRFEVRDSGPGIAPEKLSRLFAAFEQGDASTTRQFGGTGLGLVITRHLARLMGGDAGAHSREGEGSTFWVTVEMRLGDVESDFGREAALKGRRALLVDDLAEARMALSRMLRRMGLRCDVAASGEEALRMRAEAARSLDDYEVVVVDWLMPGMDGLELVSRYRDAGKAADPAFVDPLFVMVSVSSEETLVRRAKLVGIPVLLGKPVSLSALHDSLVRPLTQSRTLKPAITAGLVSERSLRERHRGARVLLAEDNMVNQEVAISLMEVAGLEVHVASNGREAVAMASSTDYALILMDMQMPVLDGIGASKLLRAEPRTLHVPIIAMTANAYVEDREACLAAGMNDFLTKPVDPALLYDVLGRWLDLVAENAEPADSDGDPIHVDGLDTARGVMFFGGSDKAYREALRKFVSARLYEHASRLSDMSAGDENFRSRARADLHAVGSACAYIGATALAEETARVTGLIDDAVPDAELQSRLQSFDASLDRMVEALRNIPGIMAD